MKRLFFLISCYRRYTPGEILSVLAHDLCLFIKHGFKRMQAPP